MKDQKILAVNIPADGLFLAIWEKAGGDLSPENCKRLIREYMDRFLEAKPDILFLNVNYRRALTPSQVFDSYLYNVQTDENGYALRDEKGETVKTLSPTTQGVSKYFSAFVHCARPLLEQGIDLYKILTDYLQSKDCKVYLSVRVNDGHYTDDPAINSAFAMKNGGAHTIEKDGVNLDFSQEAVQNHIYSYIEELLQTYKVDGIEMDWLRFPTVLPEQSRENKNILTDYMHRIRGLLDRVDPALGLAVRLYPEEERNLRNGVDVCRWIAEGCTQILTIENFYVPTNFEMPVAAWRQRIADRNPQKREYTLLCGSDWAVSCRPGYHIPMNPALVRGFTRECLDRGADGVYLFNFFEEDAYSSREMSPEGLKPCFSQRLLAARQPEELPRRWVHIGATSRRYPITLAPGDSYEFTTELKKPYGMPRLIVGVSEETALQVTAGDTVLFAEKEPVLPGYEYGGGVKGGEFVYAVTEVAPAVYTAVLPQADEITIAIKNKSQHTAELLWLEIHCQ